MLVTQCKTTSKTNKKPFELKEPKHLQIHFCSLLPMVLQKQSNHSIVGHPEAGMDFRGTHNNDLVVKTWLLLYILYIVC
jgi:hypothetical protein